MHKSRTNINWMKDLSDKKNIQTIFSEYASYDTQTIHTVTNNIRIQDIPNILSYIKENLGIEEEKKEEKEEKKEEKEEKGTEGDLAEQLKRVKLKKAGTRVIKKTKAEKEGEEKKEERKKVLLEPDAIAAILQIIYTKSKVDFFVFDQYKEDLNNIKQTLEVKDGFYFNWKEPETKVKIETKVEPEEVEVKKTTTPPPIKREPPKPPKVKSQPLPTSAPPLEEDLSTQLAKKKAMLKRTETLRGGVVEKTQAQIKEEKAKKEAEEKQKKQTLDNTIDEINTKFEEALQEAATKEDFEIIADAYTRYYTSNDIDSSKEIEKALYKAIESTIKDDDNKYILYNTVLEAVKTQPKDQNLTSIMLESLASLALGLGDKPSQIKNSATRELLEKEIQNLRDEINIPSMGTITKVLTTKIKKEVGEEPIVQPKEKPKVVQPEPTPEPKPEPKEPEVKEPIVQPTEEPKVVQPEPPKPEPKPEPVPKPKPELPKRKERELPPTPPKKEEAPPIPVKTPQEIFMATMLDPTQINSYLELALKALETSRPHKMQDICNKVQKDIQGELNTNNNLKTPPAAFSVIYQLHKKFQEIKDYFPVEITLELSFSGKTFNKKDLLEGNFVETFANKMHGPKYSAPLIATSGGLGGLGSALAITGLIYQFQPPIALNNVLFSTAKNSLKELISNAEGLDFLNKIVDNVISVEGLLLVTGVVFLAAAVVLTTCAIVHTAKYDKAVNELQDLILKAQPTIEVGV